MDCEPRNNFMCLQFCIFIHMSMSSIYITITIQSSFLNLDSLTLSVNSSLLNLLFFTIPKTFVKLSNFPSYIFLNGFQNKFYNIKYVSHKKKEREFKNLCHSLPFFCKVNFKYQVCFSLCNLFFS